MLKFHKKEKYLFIIYESVILTVFIINKLKEMKELLKPLFDDETIPHFHSTKWIDFVVNNFTKEGKEIPKKSVQNEISRHGWQ